MKHEERQILAHTLGAQPRYRKKDWGFRNRFLAGVGSDDFKHCESLVNQGMMIKRSGWRDDEAYFAATKEGAIAVGFKQYQLRGKEFPSN